MFYLSNSLGDLRWIICSYILQWSLTVMDKHVQVESLIFEVRPKIKTCHLKPRIDLIQFKNKENNLRFPLQTWKMETLKLPKYYHRPSNFIYSLCPRRLSLPLTSPRLFIHNLHKTSLCPNKWRFKERKAGVQNHPFGRKSESLNPNLSFPPAPEACFTVL